MELALVLIKKLIKDNLRQVGCKMFRLLRLAPPLACRVFSWRKGRNSETNNNNRLGVKRPNHLVLVFTLQKENHLPPGLFKDKISN